MTEHRVDEIIAEAWDICTEQDDESAPQTEFGCHRDLLSYGFHDMWWAVSVTCSHGKSRGVTNGVTDLTRGFERMLENFKELHGVE